MSAAGRRQATAASYDALATFISGLGNVTGPKGFTKALQEWKPTTAAAANPKKALPADEGAAEKITAERRAFIRAVYIAMPAPFCMQLPETALAAQDVLLKEELDIARANGEVVSAAGLPRQGPNISVWRGDMSLLEADAVVNPGNQALLGCFLPRHKCLDNILHAQSGPRLRIACAKVLNDLGIKFDENGNCRPTAAFALPAKQVFHTVGPDLQDEYDHRAPPRKPTAEDQKELRSCYSSCLDVALASNLKSVAFCCISTGIFGYPSEDAAKAAVATVLEWRAAHPEGKDIQVIFNTFMEKDYKIYLQVVPDMCGTTTTSEAEATTASASAAAPASKPSENDDDAQ